jgi:hypothetical protein
VDFVTKLPWSVEGFDCVISVIDHLTKWVYFLPAVEQGLTAEAFSTKFCDVYVRLHGVPDVIISDHDPSFVVKFWTSLMSTLKIKLGRSPAYHAQTDGQIENVNHVITKYLRVFVQHTPDM